MGDIADAMINGDMDFMTGEWLGDGGGYPRTTESNHPNSIHKKSISKPLFVGYKNCKELNGIAKFLKMRKVGNYDALRIVKDFCADELFFEGTVKECAVMIQKDFGKFVKYVDNHTKS